MFLNLFIYLFFFYSFQDCIADADRALEMDPDNTTALTNKGIGLFELNDLDKAMEVLTEAKTKAGGISCLF